MIPRTLHTARPAARDDSKSRFLQRFLARTAPDVAASFTPAQLQAIHHAFGMRYAVGHSLDVRRSVALPWGRYYFVMLAGRDRQPQRAKRWMPVALVLASATMLANVAVQTLCWR